MNASNVVPLARRGRPGAPAGRQCSRDVGGIANALTPTVGAQSDPVGDSSAPVGDSSAPVGDQSAPIEDPDLTDPPHGRMARMTDPAQTSPTSSSRRRRRTTRWPRRCAGSTAAGFTEQSRPIPGRTGRAGATWCATARCWPGRCPRAAASGTPLRIFAAHTDSPTLKVKPNPDIGRGRAGGRSPSRSTAARCGTPGWTATWGSPAGSCSTTARTVLVDVHRPLLRVPQLAIHLDRQRQPGPAPRRRSSTCCPIWGLGAPAEGDLLEFLAARSPTSIADDVAAPRPRRPRRHPARAARRGGGAARGAAAGQPRLGARRASARCSTPPRTADVIPVFVGFDHEEIGSASATGARGRCWRTC